MTFLELAETLEQTGAESVPPYRVEQIFSWISRGALSFDRMTDLPQAWRRELAGRFSIRGSRVSGRLDDPDGTSKLRFTLTDGAVIEAVLLASEKTGPDREPGRSYTACLSTQAGCPVGCVFCKTGSLGFLRNLDTFELTDQFLALSDLVRERNGGSCRISHIVVMGMGEPLLNLAALRKALAILCDPRGFGFSKRRITISTSGIRAGILELAEQGPEAELALSLTTAREDLRRRLMPGAGENSLEDLKEALKIYQEKTGRRITLEAVLLGGINTGAGDARALAAFAKGLKAAVNLIPWNPVPGLSFGGEKIREPPAAETGRFRRLLEQEGIQVTGRYRRGRGISGACGQLAGS
ncbi:MAG: 23S rRNA (adenine(2503)-C(2))-methyltransferase RlmN [Treponema sp.]|jgi:23S rRNA (adenine2503-C2)-methyltransferase|nr:23S rRNA (adenine(2503)-C(2))-methyltransferase RlmN [Treponema sp.]